MAYALKTSGQALDLVSCVIVDEDGSTIVDLVSGNTISVDVGVTIGTATWKGVTRSYFQTTGSGTAATGVLWTGTKPLLDANSPGFGTFIATAGLGTANGAGHVVNYGAGTSNGLYRSSGSTKLKWGTSGVIITSTSDVPQDWTKLSIGTEYIRSTSSKIYLGLESGSLALDTSATIGNYGGGTLESLGGRDGQGYQPMRVFCFAAFAAARTLSQMQALHDDWFGELIDAGGSAPTAPTIGTTTSITQTGATANWTDNSADETGFKVEYAVSPYTSWTAASNSPAAANATSLAVTGLSAGTTYKFRVAATNANGDSSWVESATFTTTSVVKGVQIQLHDGATEQASLTGITALWWDSATPSGFGAPVYATASATTDGTGWLELDLDADTTLNVADTGFLLLYKAGATAADDLVFAGRLAVVDIA